MQTVKTHFLKPESRQVSHQNGDGALIFMESIPKCQTVPRLIVTVLSEQKPSDFILILSQKLMLHVGLIGICNCATVGL